MWHHFLARISVNSLNKWKSTSTLALTQGSAVATHKGCLTTFKWEVFTFGKSFDAPLTPKFERWARKMSMSWMQSAKYVVNNLVNFILIKTSWLKLVTTNLRSFEAFHPWSVAKHEWKVLHQFPKNQRYLQCLSWVNFNSVWLSLRRMLLSNFNHPSFTQVVLLSSRL